MIRIERTITSTAAAGVVWAYLSDFANTAEWDPGTPSAERVDSGPVAVGSTFDLVARFRGKDSDIRYAVTTFEPPRMIELKGENKTVHSTDTITVSEQGAGSRVVYVAEFRLRGVAALAQPFLTGAFEKLGDEAVAGMQQHLDRLPAS